MRIVVIIYLLISPITLMGQVKFEKLENINGLIYKKGSNELFSGVVIDGVYELNYLNGKKHGRYIKWGDDKQTSVVSKTTFNNGNIDGLFYDFFEGDTIYYGEFVTGEKIGRHRYKCFSYKHPDLRTPRTSKFMKTDVLVYSTSFGLNYFEDLIIDTIKINNHKFRVYNTYTQKSPNDGFVDLNFESIISVNYNNLYEIYGQVSIIEIGKSQSKYDSVHGFDTYIHNIEFDNNKMNGEYSVLVNTYLMRTNNLSHLNQIYLGYLLDGKRTGVHVEWNCQELMKFSPNQLINNISSYSNDSIIKRIKYFGVYGDHNKTPGLEIRRIEEYDKTGTKNLIYSKSPYE